MLYVVLPFPIVFLLHEMEEIVVAPKWIKAKREVLAERFPMASGVFDRLAQLGRRGFIYAVLEELAVVLFATLYVLAGGQAGLYVWAAVVLAFSIHTVVHLMQAVVVRNYIPGLATAILSLGYSAYAVESICQALSGLEFTLCATLGTVFMVINLLLAHKLARLVANRK